MTHDGNGIYGGIFVAVCISYAFVEKDIRKIIEKGLSYIPRECEYAKVVRAVMVYYDENPGDWRPASGTYLTITAMINIPETAISSPISQ